MNQKRGSVSSLRLALRLSFFFAAAAVPTSCTVDGTWSVNSGPAAAPDSPPPAAWHSAPGFSGASLTKIAIITEDSARNGWGGQANQSPASTALEDSFIQAAFQKGYRVSDRSDVDKVLNEIHFQQSGLTESDAARLGRMLNIPAVLIVRITGSGVQGEPTGFMINGQSQYTFTAWCDMSVRLVSVEKAEVLGLASYSSRRRTDSPENSWPAVVHAAKMLAAALPGRESP